ncbi:MAG: hypothetical protein JWN89_324 [Parcubacteria group bacterium]|nr:hypothetical protein [Parcubacteria group bacterium]
MPEIWVRAEGRTLENLCDELLRVDTGTPKIGQTLPLIKGSVGVIKSDATWEKFLETTNRWSAKTCTLGLRGEGEEALQGRTWKLEHFRGYSFLETHQWFEKDLEKRPPADFSTLPTRNNRRFA